MRRVGLDSRALVPVERLAAAHPLARADVVAGVDDQPVQPGRELGLAAVLPQPDAELGKRLLGGVTCVLGIRQHLRGEPFDTGSMALAERGERLGVAVLGASDQNRITEPLVDERPLGPRVLPNLTALPLERLHGGPSLRTVDSLAREAVVPRLRGRFGRDYRYLESTPSTQLLLEPDAPEGAAVVAGEQTEGRGRLGRRWLAPPGTSLLCSIQLRPAVSGERLPELTGVAAHSCAEAIEAATGLTPELKFPNDLLVRGRKVAGVLAEAREERVVLGVGINVNVSEELLPQEVDVPATSLLVETGREVDRAELLVELLDRLERRYDAWVTAPAD
jgi:biotin-[acetyl-CoA-carboxylase] ligase BirA-like protein